MYLIEEAKPVNLLPPKDTSSSAHAAAYINMANYDHVDLILQMGATGAIGSSVAVTVTQAVNTSGSSSAALNFPAYYQNVAALGSSSTANDTFVKQSIAASSTNTFDLTPSTDNVMYIIPIDASMLSVDSSMDCVGLAVGAAGAATLCGATAILSNARYKSDNPPSAL